MFIEDKDLASIQEVRNLIRTAKKAQKELAQWNQEQIDTLVKVVTKACYEQREYLAKLAVEETGFGRWEDKVLKNTLASQGVYEEIRDLKTVGVLSEDSKKGITEVALPVGVIAGLIPSTNPTSTVIYKALLALKTGNSIIFSPHPHALKCIEATVAIIQDALKTVGAPAGVVTSIHRVSISATNELMRHKDTKLILATGGTAMVRAAYSSGTPAIGVGPGNGPAYIESSADIPHAVQQILDSKTFDNGVICASEQSIIVDQSNQEAVIAEFQRQGAYFVPDSDAKKLGAAVIQPSGLMNPQMVGKTAPEIGKLAGLSVPETARVLIARETGIGKQHPFSMEKLCPVLGFYTVKDWKEASTLTNSILQNEGIGHTFAIHSQNQEIIRHFSLYTPVSRLLVNTGSALGGVGATTNLFPALTLGCGGIGGSSTSDNISPMNLINVRRIATGQRSLADLRKAENQVAEVVKELKPECSLSDEALIEALVAKVLEKLK
ncbi:acetaldehyde dehydrogenase (acetylating) [Streptococcus sp. NLN76]|uniref:acetaldehyde dehydrogenase (acetylating) n=1 Tax=Streptococcus sp. NLN76 TaxID=2822800 RepID=UPI0018A8C60A|nr:acetaldehyde dehydrogenase (acetylating) [Streptococcus sp. NLN76]MBF8969697.1 acetaldehyde dehydrogenase (acetylating) [Streptococcus sp. NLN76]